MKHITTIMIEVHVDENDTQSVQTKLSINGEELPHDAIVEILTKTAISLDASEFTKTSTVTVADA